MPTVTANLTNTPAIGSTVWCITPSNGIIKASFIMLKASAIATGITYNVIVNTSNSSGDNTFNTDDVFDNLPDAVAQYAIRLALL